jgi:hypothetical protein
MCLRRFHYRRLRKSLQIRNLKMKIRELNITQKEQRKNANDIIDSREMITKIVTIAVVSITIVIALILVIYPLLKGEDLDLDFIGKSLLPLWGTWIGTVIAFYFGKANFDAATKTYQETIKALSPEEKIAQLFVKDIMIPVDKLQYLILEEEKENTIKSILALPRFALFNRFAVFEANRILKCIIHRSTFNQFIVNKLNASIDKTIIDKLTLQDIVDEQSPEIKNMLSNGFNFININANLLEAKKAMDVMPECLDVFVTETGRSTEPVLGLITNNMIFEKLKV